MDAFTLNVFFRTLEFLSVFYTTSVFYLVWFLPRPLFTHRLAKYAPLLVFVILMILAVLSITGVINNSFLSYELPYFIVHVISLSVLIYKFVFYYVKRRKFILEWVTIRWVMLAVVLGTAVPLTSHILIYTGHIEKLPSFALDTVVIFKVGMSALVATSILYQIEYFWWRLWVLIMGLAGVLVSYFMMITFSDLSHPYILLISMIIGYSIGLATLVYLKKSYIVDIYVAMEDILPNILTIDDKQWFDTKCDVINLPPEGQSHWINVLIYIFKPLTLEYVSNKHALTSDNTHIAASNSRQNKNSMTQSLPSEFCNNDSIKLQSDIGTNKVKVASILSGGAGLTVMDFNCHYQVRMIGANKGLKLFTNKDISLINALWRIMKQHKRTQKSFIEGEATERKRIAADLHDDIGGKLLYLASREGKVGEYAHDTLQDLRILARGLSSDSKSFGDVIADISYKIAEQCDLKSVAFNLINTLESVNCKSLNPKDATALTSIFNELTRNALNHFNVSVISCSLEQDAKHFNILFSNDGDEVDTDNWQEGLGIPSIVRRVNNWSGRVTWRAGSNGGVICELHIPWDTLFDKRDFS